MTTEAFARAKINLTLHVTGQRADGYHLLDSLVVFADLGDRVQFDAGPMMSLHVSGPFARGVPANDDNLVWQAAVAAGFRGRIQLQKNLPHGAGIGGGSADAAAVLRAFDAPDAALTLGADVPVCLSSKAQRMQGIGEQLTEISDFPALSAVLVNPGVAVPTPNVFAALQDKGNAPMPTELPAFDSSAALIDWLGTMRNDLQAPAIAVQPAIKAVIGALSACDGVGLCRMSGSGATCFALFEATDAAGAAARKLATDQPGWWVQACTLS